MKKMDFNNDETGALIVSYLTGSISHEDLVKLNEWISQSPENRNLFNEYKNAWLLSHKPESGSAIRTENSWHEFQKKLERQGSGLGLVKGRSREKANFKHYLKTAASWLLIFGLGSALTFWISGSSSKKIASFENGTIEITAPLGSRSTLKMPDNTQIWLNAGTTVKYDKDYGQHTRTVNLSGEAYFDVAKDSLHPFLVETGDITVRALGTRFNVKAYPDEKTVSATLEEGKIVVSASDDNNSDVILNPKDKLIYYKKTKETEKFVESSEAEIKPHKESKIRLKNTNILSDVRTELYTSWKDPRWIIDGEPLKTLAPMLERRFNLKIVFEDEQLLVYKFTGIIQNETVDQILNALKMTAPINYEIKKDTLRLILDVKSRENFKKVMTRN